MYTLSISVQLLSLISGVGVVLLTINSIIISIVISLTRKLEESPYLILPTSLLLCVFLVTVIFAVYTISARYWQVNIAT